MKPLNTPCQENWRQIRQEARRRRQERDLIQGAVVIFICLCAALWALGFLDEVWQ